MTLESSPAGAWAASAEGPNENKRHTISDHRLLGTYHTRAGFEFNDFMSLLYPANSFIDMTMRISRPVFHL